MIRILTAPVLSAVVLAASVGCQTQSPLGIDLGAQSTAQTAQPSSVAQDNGTFACAPETPDVYAGCPATAQEAVHGHPCALPKRTVCDYQQDGAFQSCSCMPTPSGNFWLCLGVGGGYDCPALRPADGSPCGSNDFGRSCYYPRSPACTCDADRNSPERRVIDCTCNAGAGAWQCLNVWPAMEGVSEASFIESPCYGAEPARPALDEDTLIKDLTDDQVAAWCDWFMNKNRGSGPPPPSQPPELTPDGYPSGYGSAWCTYGSTSACVSFVPVTYCEKLLRYGACDVPLRALDDCFLSLTSACEIVGDGCEQMGSHPNCRQTVVQLGTLQAPSCPQFPVKW